MWNDNQKDSFQPINWDEAYEECDRLVKEKWAKLPPIVKGFYKEHEEVKCMSDVEVEQFRTKNNNIVVSHFREGDPFPLPKPAPEFKHSFHNHPDILSVIASQNFKTPSPIQAQSWPILLQSKDLIGIAQTGTGKTLAYLLPGLLSIVAQTTPRKQRPGPSMLVLAPTRELAQQIDREAKKYSYQGIESLCIYGGGNRNDQVIQYRKKPEIVIATPGRLNDLTNSDVIDLTAVNYLVLDEADRMLDMGFMPQIRKVMVDVRPDRQTVMMSATWPPGVRKIAKDFMNDPLQIFVGSLDLAAVNSVTQEIIILAPEEKRKHLYNFILNTMSEKDKAIVFVGRKSVADDISSELALNEIACQCMHGDRDQEDRERALADIKSGEVRLIIATDVASRGLDIDDITYILNYDFPSHAEEYVHRVGRTGRAGRSGKSITFFTREDWRHAQELIDILSKSNAVIPDELVSMADRYSSWQERKKAEDAAAAAMGGGRGGGRFGPPRDGASDFFGGGGGGGGGANRNCFNCQQPGHLSRDCPNRRQPRNSNRQLSNSDNNNHSQSWTTGGGSGRRGGGFAGDGSSWTSGGNVTRDTDGSTSAGWFGSSSSSSSRRGRDRDSRSSSQQQQQQSQSSETDWW